MNKDIDYSSLVEHIGNLVGMKEYLSIVFDAVKTHRLTKDEFIHIVIAIESNAFDNGLDYAQDRTAESEDRWLELYNK